MGTAPTSPQTFAPIRKYPRLKYATPVVIEYAGRSLMGTTEDIAIGGLGACCDTPPPVDARIGVRFNLPTGASIRTNANVRYVLPARFGAQFMELEEDARGALEAYTRTVLGYVRRGGRVAKRLHVTLCSAIGDDGTEQLAETVILSRNGGRLICRARFKIGEQLRLYWPQKKREAQIRIVFRKICGTGELTDLGFEFLGELDFWGPELQS